MERACDELVGSLFYCLANRTRRRSACGPVRATNMPNPDPRPTCSSRAASRRRSHGLGSPGRGRGSPRESLRPARDCLTTSAGSRRLLARELGGRETPTGFARLGARGNGVCRPPTLLRSLAALRGPRRSPSTSPRHTQEKAARRDTERRVLMLRRLAFGLLAVGLLAMAAPAFAQPPTTGNHPRKGARRDLRRRHTDLRRGRPPLHDHDDQQPRDARDHLR